MGSPLRAFQWAYDQRRTMPLSPKGGSKMQSDRLCRFWLGISKKVCYRVALCENYQRQSCKAFTGLSIRAQIVGGGHPLKCKFCSWREPPVSAASLHPVALRCLLTGETNWCNSNLQQCSLNTKTTLIFAPQLAHAAARSLCDSWATCIICMSHAICYSYGTDT